MLLALTVLAGNLDAFSILRLGDVFVATMTGNLVFLGLAAAGAHGFDVGSSALALGGFAIGVLIGSRAWRTADSHRGLALRNVLAIKFWLAGAATVIAIATGPHFPSGAQHAMIVLLAISMGAQLAVIRLLKVPDLLTVVLTMAMTGVLVEYRGGLNDPRLVRRVLSILAFVIGALIGGSLILYVGGGVAMAFALGIIIAVAVAAHLVSRTSTDWSAPR